VKKVDPEYTAAAKQAGISGSVRLRFYVNQNGFPERIRVIRGLGYGLNQNAIQALSHWRFRPAMRGGQPEVSEAETDVQFEP
jgi:TonB family protein